MLVRQLFVDTPLGVLRVRGSDDVVEEVTFVPRHGEERGSQVLRATASALLEYFEAGRRVFSAVPLPPGPEFRPAVWRATCRVPFGETRTYGQMAQAIGRPKASRAVGTALAHNRLALIIPCHRIVGARGLGGYAWGADRKEWLLRHEGRMEHKEYKS